MKKLFTLILAAAVAIAALTSCDAEKVNEVSEVSDGPATLRLVSEHASDATHGEMNYSAVYPSLLDIRGEYQYRHQDVNIELEMLPPGGSEREITLQNLRTEIMSGKGPDLFLLPAGKVRGVFSTKTFRTETEDPLFEDVEQAMRNRLFYDLSEFYDNDTDLKTEELQPDIMEAGVYDGCRYVLPIAWNMPLIAVDKGAAKALGMEESAFTSGVYGLWDAALASGNETLIGAASFMQQKEICLFPRIFDYDAGTTNLTEEALTEYYTGMAKLAEAQGGSLSFSYGSMVLSAYTGSEKVGEPFSTECPFRLIDLLDVPNFIALDEFAEDVDMEYLPLRATDGSSVAEVAYWGAINANSAHPKEAYDFLREFLGEAVQFQGKYGTSLLNYRENDCAWPVRVKGSVKPKCGKAIGFAYSTRYMENGKFLPETERQAKLGTMEFDDSALPVLFEPIDEVRFATPLSAELLFANATYPKTEEEIQEVSKKLATLAQYHIAES